MKLKTKRIADPDGGRHGYRITTPAGASYVATPVGASKFESDIGVGYRLGAYRVDSNGVVTGTLKEIKAAIVAAAEQFSAAASGNVSAVLAADPTAEAVGATVDPMSPEFDHIDPCAVLIALLVETRYFTATPAELRATELFQSATHSLDANGWLTDAGELDVDRAKREIARYRAAEARRATIDTPGGADLDDLL